MHNLCFSQKDDKFVWKIDKIRPQSTAEESLALPPESHATSVKSSLMLRTTKDPLALFKHTSNWTKRWHLTLTYVSFHYHIHHATNFKQLFPCSWLSWYLLLLYIKLSISIIIHLWFIQFSSDYWFDYQVIFKHVLKITSNVLKTSIAYSQSEFKCFSRTISQYFHLKFVQYACVCLLPL